MASSENKQIIELHPEKPDQGEIRYTYSATPKASSFVVPQNFLTKIFGICLGVGLLVFFVFFFVYVVIPVVAVVLLVAVVRNLSIKT